MAGLTLTRAQRARMLIQCGDALDTMESTEAIATLRAFGMKDACFPPPQGRTLDQHVHDCLETADNGTIAELHGHLYGDAQGAPETTPVKEITLPDGVLLPTQQDELVIDLEARGFSRADFRWVRNDAGPDLRYALEFVRAPSFRFNVQVWEDRGVTKYILHVSPGQSQPLDVRYVTGFKGLRSVFAVWLRSVSREGGPSLWKQPPQASDWLQQDTPEEPLTRQQQRQFAQGLDELRLLVEQQGHATAEMLATVHRDVEAIKTALPQATVRSATHAVGIALLKWTLEGIADALLLPDLVKAARVMLEVAGLIDIGKLPPPPGGDL